VIIKLFSLSFSLTSAKDVVNLIFYLNSNGMEYYEQQKKNEEK
jgi:hypothetical protein